MSRGKESGSPVAALLREVKGAVWLEQRLRVGDWEGRQGRKGSWD